jgi:hypothetical protein
VVRVWSSKRSLKRGETIDPRRKFEREITEGVNGEIERETGIRVLGGGKEKGPQGHG